MNVDPATLDAKSISTYTAAAAGNSGGFIDFLLHVIPGSVDRCLRQNEILPILLFSTLFGIALSHLGPRGKPMVDVLEAFSHGMFFIVGMIMRVAPLAACGAMAFTVGKYGLGSIVSLGKLMATMYLTCFLFVVVVLGAIARLCGFNLWKFLKYLKEELFTVLGTSSSESVVPQLMNKLEKVGVSKPVVGLVIPSGLTFNPDGQCIYYTMAAIFIAQATNTPLTLMDQLIVLGVLLLTSKGSAGVTGSGFITLAATLATMDNIRWPAWSCCWAWTASCPKPGPSPTPSATRSAPWPSPTGWVRWTSSAWPRPWTASYRPPPNPRPLCRTLPLHAWRPAHPHPDLSKNSKKNPPCDAVRK